MKGSLFSPLVERAMRVAARAHRDQTRKSSDVPYISHPAGVAMILLRAGFDDENVLAAALLHDVVEDTNYSADKLAAEFPAKVAELVTVLTEHKLDDTGIKRSWQVRKEEHLAVIAVASSESRAIVLSDKLHNLGAMLFDLDAGIDIWSRFNVSPDKILWYHREMIDRAEQNDERIEGLAKTCRQLLARLTSAVESSPKRYGLPDTSEP